jgi:cysteine-rich repeat protein
VSGSVGDATYTAATSIPIASASKWLYGAYVAELRSGTLTALDKRHLSLTSGYHGFPDGAGNIIACLTGQTVVGCAYYQSNEVKTSGDVDKFYYNGGSLQIHAATGSGIGAGLGALYSAGLATEMRAKLGTEIALSYGQPRPDGGITTTPGDYATFLRKLVAGTYDLTALLGTDAQCAYLGGGCDAVFTPIPADEQWHYSLGHWVEDDPTVGDGAFSSPGWFGFYPWVDATKSTYGIVARVSTAPTAAFDSADCGRMIRKAYASPTLVECNNGLDDDGDNLVDMGDAGCASSGDTIESNCGDGSVRGAEECDDGNTSSGDGCSSTCETEVSASECSDGIDNDADGSIDYPWDSGCTLATDTSE